MKLFERRAIAYDFAVNDCPEQNGFVALALAD